jgi:predicted AAA+ superfamily ATPase
LDSGIICYLTGIETQRQILDGLLSGSLFENYCIAETIKCFYNQARRPNIFYLRTQNGLEVDLIIEKADKIYPFEIKLTKTPNIGLAKPLERFKKIFGKLNMDKGRIISLSKEEGPLTKEVDLVSLDNYLDMVLRISS